MIFKKLSAMSKKKKRLFHFAVTMLFIIVGVAGLIALTASKSQLEKSRHVAPMPMVRVIKIHTGPKSIHIRGEGTVRPLRKINLVPQVGGKVVYVSPALVDGGEFRRGDTLLTINPVDYELAVTLARARVKDSESKLKIIQEEAAVAQEEWCVHYAGNSDTQKKAPPLVAKEPQLAAAQAQLDADRANLKKAFLNLERTVLNAPFDGRVSEKNVDVGQYVSPGQTLAALYSTDAAEIAVPLEDENLFWFDVPGFTPGNAPGSSATVRARLAGRDLVCPGRVVRAEGELNEKTRMINIIVRVDKPYARKPPLAMGLFVTVEIEGRVLPAAAVIPRTALHQGNVVWVVNGDGVLRFRKVDVAHHQGEGVIVRSGLKDEEMVVISPLKAVTDGMVVRTAIIKEPK
ncbi:MAG: efflux RND transporter periplasmic adaptor subunit [Proteobacteria bacterium]|nr:efflux RND transporter periplasmic adaptor subunit [Pseudomonadota bacterium]